MKELYSEICFHQKKKNYQSFRIKLDDTGEQSHQLVEKIESLSNDIKKLKENEDDRLKATFD